MGIVALVLLIALVASPQEARSQTAADSAAIRQTALDYIEGWYTGNAARMERALHPGLAKRIVRTDGQTGSSTLGHMGADELVQRTAQGSGTRTPEAMRRTDVTILDVFENAASVRVTATDWVDYLHIVRFDGRWLIVNVLWELFPRSS